MALHKLNVFHWHLMDDQGWRHRDQEISQADQRRRLALPRARPRRQDIDAATGKPRLYGGFYTQDQVREIVAYASDRNITIIPEIEMPGHATAAIVAYPQYWLGQRSAQAGRPPAGACCPISTMWTTRLSVFSKTS